MPISEDEEENVPQFIRNYRFVNENKTPISFSVLPFWWDGAERANTSRGRVFLNGIADGHQMVYKQVTSWKLGLEGDEPEISVLTKENEWIRLLNPMKSYLETARTIMITIHWLHFLRRNPEAFAKSVWEHLSKPFRSFVVGPSVNDLRDHTSLIKLVAERDGILSNSQFLMCLETGEERMGEERGRNGENMGGRWKEGLLRLLEVVGGCRRVAELVVPLLSTAEPGGRGREGRRWREGHYRPLKDR